jgi:hypothetical protein
VFDGSSKGVKGRIDELSEGVGVTTEFICFDRCFESREREEASRETKRVFTSFQSPSQGKIEEVLKGVKKFSHIYLFE